MTHRAEFAVIVLGTIFLFIGVGACCIAAVRGGNTRRILAWFGIFSAWYGVRLFAAVPTAFSLLVGPFSSSAPQVVWIITYVIMIPALLFWAELTVGTFRYRDGKKRADYKHIVVWHESGRRRMEQN
jgi:hypothetical protein